MADNSNEVMENESDSDDGLTVIAVFEFRKDKNRNWGQGGQVWPVINPMQGAATSATSRPGAATSSTSMQGAATSSTSASMQAAAKNEMTGGWSSTDEDETWFERATRDQNPLTPNNVKSKRKLKNKKMSKNKCRCD